MSFDKERSRNTWVMLSGVTLVCLGLVLAMTVNKIGGIVILIIGISILMVAWAILNMFYQLDMKEMLDNSKRSKK